MCFFVVEEYTGQEAWYLGEKIYSLQHKISAKGIPHHLHTDNLYDKLINKNLFVYNAIVPDKYHRIIGNTVSKQFSTAIIPVKRYFINHNYSKAYS